MGLSLCVCVAACAKIISIESPPPEPLTNDLKLTVGLNTDGNDPFGTHLLLENISSNSVRNVHYVSRWHESSGLMRYGVYGIRGEVIDELPHDVPTAVDLAPPGMWRSMSPNTPVDIDMIYTPYHSRHEHTNSFQFRVWNVNGKLLVCSWRE